MKYTVQGHINRMHIFNLSKTVIEAFTHISASQQKCTYFYVSVKVVTGMSKYSGQAVTTVLGVVCSVDRDHRPITTWHGCLPVYLWVNRR